MKEQGGAAVRMFDTPFGRIGVVATARGIRQVVLPPNVECQMLNAKCQSRTLRRGSAAAEALAARAEREIRDYLAGRRRTFAVAVDLDAVPPFQRKALAAVGKVPYGKTVTYGELARRVGRPRAARAVGQAMAHNPVPLVVPCHRVVASGGGLGGFGGGLDLKRRLLALEAGNAK